MIQLFIVGTVGKFDTKQIGGKFVLNFSVVSNDFIGGEKKATWITCQKWNPGNMVKYIATGVVVGVTGSYSIYKSSKTGKEYMTCLVEKMNFFGRKSDGLGTGADVSEDDITGSWDHLNNVESPF